MIILFVIACNLRFFLMDLITNMKIFINIADKGSLASAGRDLNLSPSVISKSVNALEDRLGARLLNRTTRSVSLTEVGRAYLDRARRIVGDVEEAEAAVSSVSNAPRGHLRITAPSTFSYRHVAPHLPVFREKYPEVEVEMIISDNQLDLIENNIDIAIRIALLKDSSLIARKIASNLRSLVASPGYLIKYGKPKHPDDLSKHNIISFALGSSFNEWHFKIKGKPKKMIAKGMLQLNHGDAILRAAINGGGIAMLSRFVVGRHIAAGTLIPLLDDFLEEDIPIYAVYPSGKHLSPKVRAFLDFLLEIYGTTPYWDENGDHESDAAKRASL